MWCVRVFKFGRPGINRAWLPTLFVASTYSVGAYRTKSLFLFHLTLAILPKDPPPPPLVLFSNQFYFFKNPSRLHVSCLSCGLFMIPSPRVVASPTSCEPLLMCCTAILDQQSTLKHVRTKSTATKKANFYYEYSIHD